VGDRELALAALERAFGRLERPSNEALLHPDCSDDGDLLELYEVADWREMSDELVVRNYAAPSFLSAAGFRYFLPAFMRYALTHPESPEFVIESTVRHLAPGGEWDEFMRSKLAEVDADQAAAIRLFLAVVPEVPGAAEALVWWTGPQAPE
jgi:uncharacterized protein DUF6714